MKSKKSVAKKIVAIVSSAAAATGLALTVVGFGSGGIVAGSIASGIQSGIGNVAAGSVFATLQSIGATGGFLWTSAIGIFVNALSSLWGSSHKDKKRLKSS